MQNIVVDSLCVQSFITIGCETSDRASVLCKYDNNNPKKKHKNKNNVGSAWGPVSRSKMCILLLPFQKRLDFRVLLQLVDILNTTFILNIERAADIHH